MEKEDRLQVIYIYFLFKEDHNSNLFIVLNNCKSL